MQSIDHEVLRHARDWLNGQSPWLCTIVKTLGSSPRPVGSLVVISRDGQQVGSVSGGCVEEDLVERLQAGEYDTDVPALVEYGVTAEENERLGLPCGGTITLVIQRLGPRDRDWLDGALAALDARHCIARELILADGATTLHETGSFTALQLTQDTLRQCFGPRRRMLLVGAGQLAQCLAQLAIAMDYEVVVTDSRENFIAQWEGPDIELVYGMPDDVIRERGLDQESVVITLTHDPRIDDMALMEALPGKAGYVGALGSVRTTAKRLERLRLLDIAESDIARLHAPVGLDIGSKTPMEIAVSIMAQLTSLRRAG